MSWAGALALLFGVLAVIGFAAALLEWLGARRDQIIRESPQFDPRSARHRDFSVGRDVR
jgi:hypothetical protein